jgi:hypothetical protein
LPYELAPFRTIPLDEPLLKCLIAEHELVRLPRLQRLWSYYRNALAEPTDEGGSSGSPRQSVGLPTRLRTRREVNDDRARREIVIENDIAWRVHALVDFMFPAPPRLVSQAHDPSLRATIEEILTTVIEASGGAQLWQDAALLGGVFGSVQFLLSLPSPGMAPSKTFHASPADLAASFLIETVEATRAIPLLSRDDYRSLDALIIHYQQQTNEVERESMFDRVKRALRRTTATDGSHAALDACRRGSVTVTHIISAAHMQRYEDGRLVDERINRLGRLPLVHVQNLSQPLCHDGLSDVEPLIPLQDELNTRLSDRANRVTMQSFRMWLGKGIEGFTDRPVGPGQMWMTDNTEASIEAFGGDADSPSERQHIEELREALDKASGVTPAAAGHIKARIGNLTSENALRISLMGTLAKIKRKRITYGRGIAQLCELILHAMHVHDVLRTDERDRRVEIAWPDPLPIDESRRLNDALLKQQLGVPAETLRAELGYAG